MGIFQVYLNGNELVSEFDDMKPALRKCLSLRRNESNYVELRFVNPGGQRTLVSYWN